MMMQEIGIFILLVSFCNSSLVSQFDVGGYRLYYYDHGADYIPFCKAIIACSSQIDGGYLVKVDSPEIEDAIGYMRAGRYVWIGATDQYTHNYWFWLDGTAVNDGFNNWGPGEPNDIDDAHNCACIGEFFANEWDDVKCGTTMGYICQQKLQQTDDSRCQATGYTLPVNDLVASERMGAQTYAEAKAECERLGKRLVGIKTVDTYKALRNESARRKGIKLWAADLLDRREETGRCPAIDENGLEYYNCSEASYHFICESAPDVATVVPAGEKNTEKTREVPAAASTTEDSSCESTNWILPMTVALLAMSMIVVLLVITTACAICFLMAKRWSIGSSKGSSKDSSDMKGFSNPLVYSVADQKVE